MPCLHEHCRVVTEEKDTLISRIDTNNLLLGIAALSERMARADFIEHTNYHELTLIIH